MCHNVKRCTKCALSDKFPKIRFDGNGICNYCSNQYLSGTHETEIEKARETVSELIHKYRGSSTYDAIVCYSGGKDSTYTLKLAVDKYKLRPLAFTFDNGFMSSMANQNIHRVCDALNVDHFTFRASSEQMKAIIRASVSKQIYNPRTLTRISAGCNSCISIVNMTALRTALEKRIPFIITGFTLGQIPVNSIIFRHSWDLLQESRQTTLAALKNETGGFIDNYFSINKSTVAAADEFPAVMNLLCMEKLSEQEIIDAITPLGWINPEDVDGCSSNCRLSAFNNYAHEKQFGYSPYELELSQLIRKGPMTREAAILKLENQPIEQARAIMGELNLNETDLPGLNV